MTKRFVNLILVILISVTALSACAFFGGDGDKNDDTGKYTRFVYSDESLDLLEVRSKVADIMGILPTMLDIEPAAKGEIVFGFTNRQISKDALAALEGEIAKNTKYDTGYIIYAKDGSVAVYWKNADMASIAIDHFIKVCVDEKRLVLEDGVIASKLYLNRDFEEQKYWLQLESRADAEVVEALKQLYNYYDGERIVDWLANLYDPVIGGFYYSRSARDNEPFRPDIESTAQGISFLLNNDAISSRSQFPEEIRKKLVEFARSLQSAEDGYFYHPQWPQGKENLQTDRYGRDMGWATSTITNFTYDDDGDGVEDKQYPFWCAPNGVKCELHAGTTETCSFPQSVAYYSDRTEGAVSTALTTSTTSAVSRVSSSVATPTASVSSKPDYSSATAFSTWLEAYNATVKEDSGRAHNLAAIKSEIVQKGYIEIVMNHLDRVQAEVFDEQMKAGEEPTGLWQKNVDYKAVWGLLKYMSFYNASGYGRKIDIKYVPYIAKTVVKVIELPPNGAYASNDLYNQWSGISDLISNVKKYYGSTGVQQIYDILRANCASLISNSLEKIEPFRQEDGSFSSSSSGLTGVNIYGTRISLGVAEGNVNSTGLICSMYRSIYTALGLPLVPLASAADGEKFMQTLLTCEPITKNELDDGALDFESGKLSQNIEQNIKNSGSAITVEDAPGDRDGKAMYFVSYEADTNGDGFAVSTVSGGSSCYIFESDFYVSSETEDTTFLQIKMDTAYMVIFIKSGDTVTIRESTSTASGAIKNTLTTASTDEWFKLRVEYYVNGESQNALDVPCIKIFLDDEYVTTSNAFYGSHTAGKAPSNSYGKVNVLSLRAATSFVYMDNIFCSAEDKLYDEVNHSITDSRGE
ncbi:MAG: hypothetical protein IJW03_03455 [Clostridia bacterium]|nr:hypothetical protein [Clostridia bacterium]